MPDHQPKPNEPKPLEYERLEQRKRGLNVALLVVAVVLALVAIGAAIWFFRVQPSGDVHIHDTYIRSNY